MNIKENWKTTFLVGIGIAVVTTILNQLPLKSIFGTPEYVLDAALEYSHIKMPYDIAVQKEDKFIITLKFGEKEFERIRKYTDIRGLIRVSLRNNGRKKIEGIKIFLDDFAAPLYLQMDKKVAKISTWKEDFGELSPKEERSIYIWIGGTFSPLLRIEEQIQISHNNGAVEIDVIRPVSGLISWDYYQDELSYGVMIFLFSLMTIGVLGLFGANIYDHRIRKRKGSNRK